jgi:hypothetical protein
VTSTLVSLFVVPALYLRFGSTQREASVSLAASLERRARVLARRGRSPQEIPVRSESSS